MEEYLVKAYGAEHFARISKALTHPPSYSCIRVNTLKSSRDAIIEKLVAILEDNGLLTGTSNMHIGKQNGLAESDQHLEQGNCQEASDIEMSKTFGHGDASAGRLQGPSIRKCQYPGLDTVIFVIGSGPHKLDYGYGVHPDQPMKEVIVSRKCAEAVLRGAQVFVPGVLACSAHVEEGDMVAVSVAVEQPLDGKWGVGITRGTVLQGLHSDPQYHKRSGLYIGQGVASMSRTGMFRVLKGIAVEMIQRVYKLPSLHNVLEGEIFLQNLPSIVTAHVLDPQEDEQILDMCAAPGGKTTAIAMLMNDKGVVVALDRSHNKVMDIKKLAAEMGLTCIHAYKLDALKSVRRTQEKINSDVHSETLDTTVNVSVASKITNGDGVADDTEKCKSEGFVPTGNCENSIKGRYVSKADIRKDTRRMRNGPGRSHSIGARVENSKGFMPNSFDRVLLDAPCSALGLRPRLFAAEETIESLQHDAKYQRKMFDQAVQLVRPGGVMVYSTCTINPGENEALVRYALDTYKFLSLAPQNPRVGGPGLVGHCELFDGKYMEKWLTQSEAELVQRFDPSSSVDSIGFFIAKFNVGQKDMKVADFIGKIQT